MTQNPVTLETVDGIGVVTIDSPPMNTLSLTVRRNLMDAVECALGDDSITAVLVVCAGRTFIAGAEISEFGKPRQPPAPADILAKIEAANKPVIASLHGTALGAGCEFAMGCHYRVALASAKVGLPEVHLGILPGGGGTQRLPRLIGPEKALEMMLSGRHVPAPEALTLGLIDECAHIDDPLIAGLAFARKVLVEKRPPRPTSSRIVSAPENRDFLADALSGLAITAKGLMSPFRIVECVRAATELPFPDGLKRERELARECQASPQREALVYAFFAERRTRKLAEIEGLSPSVVGKAGVVGGDIMGAGITAALMNAGIPVIMIVPDTAAATRARQNINRVYDRAVARGQMKAAARDKILNVLFECRTDYAALADTDLAIEAVSDDGDLRKDVFRKLDAVLKPGAIMATGSPHQDLGELAAATSRPGDVIALHFISPDPRMRLLELGVGDATKPDVLASGFALARQLGRVGVRAGACAGLIGNRMRAQAEKAADHMIEDGASPYDLDRAVAAFGFPMGPFQAGDLAGLDRVRMVRKRGSPARDLKERYVKIADRLCERGWFGVTSGRGYYIYDDDTPQGRPDPEVTALIEAERRTRGIVPRTFAEDEIMRRYLAIMINEGCKLLAGGIARRPLDIDVTAMLGYGFPRWRGGPMKYADMTGPASILADLQTFAQEDPDFWAPSALLVDLVGKNKNFDSLNEAR